MGLQNASLGLAELLQEFDFSIRVNPSRRVVPHQAGVFESVWDLADLSGAGKSETNDR